MVFYFNENKSNKTHGRLMLEIINRKIVSNVVWAPFTLARRHEICDLRRQTPSSEVTRALCYNSKNSQELYWNHVLNIHTMHSRF
jgi:hypothetical protein